MSKIITITDGLGHMRETIRLTGRRMDGESWVIHTLRANGCRVSSEQDDDAIAEAVRASWTASGYDGDPDANGLAVHVRRAD